MLHWNRKNYVLFVHNFCYVCSSVQAHPIGVTATVPFIKYSEPGFRMTYTHTHTHLVLTLDQEVEQLLSVDYSLSKVSH